MRSHEHAGVMHPRMSGCETAPLLADVVIRRFMVCFCIGTALATAVQAGIVSGTVRHKYSQAPLSGAVISIIELSSSARTNALGVYQFGYIPSGTYTFRAVLDGYRPSERTVYVPPSPLQLYVQADTYVNDMEPNRNYGGDVELRTKTYTQYNRYAYVRFDLSSIRGGVQSAQLRLWGRLGNAQFSNVPVRVHAMEDVGWDEYAVTWNNRPSFGVVVATAVVADATSRWYSWDVSSYIRDRHAAGRSVVSMALSSDGILDVYTIFNSREASGNQPQLVIIASSGAGPVNSLPTVSLTSPVNGSTYAAPATVNLAATATDSDGSIARVEFWTGATLLNADTASPYAYSWAGVGAGSYALRAIAYDNQGATSTSTVVNITVYSSGTPANQLPVVSLTSPVNGSTYTAPASITMIATATDSDGAIAVVRFYQGTTMVGQDSTSPYDHTWTGVSSGTYQLRAVAQDNQGAVSTSAVVSVTVYPPNQPPTVTMTSPVNGSTYTAPADIALAATATDLDGSIANVRFYRGSTLLNTDTASPYEYTWVDVSSGTYQLRAVAQDNQGATSTSTVVTVTVLSSSTPPVWYTLTATANPANGGIVSPASGTYLAGSQIQVTATPNTNYTFASWSGDAAGTNPTITITMDSNKSIVANFTYVPPANSSPTVSITSPQDGATYTAPASITVTATAVDTDGTIAFVRFYSGTALLGTDSESPYSYTWTDVQLGVYLLTVRAYDDRGAAGVSESVEVTVLAAQSAYYTLTATARPADGGIVTLNPPPTGNGYFEGTQVTLTATPSTGYEFTGWTGDITGSSTTNPMTVVMLTDKTLTANFRLIQSLQPQPALQPGEVRVSGGPNGYVDAGTDPNVVIRLRRTVPGAVTVRIYDLRGRLVAQKSKDGVADVDDDIVWNAADLPAGVYIVRIKGGGISEISKRVVVVR